MKALTFIRHRRDALVRFITISTLRLITGAAQFSVILFLTSKLSLEDLGSYTIFTIYTTYLTLLTGFNIHSHTIRELGMGIRENWPFLLIQNYKFLFINGCVILMFSIALFQLNWINHDSYINLLFIVILSVINSQAENFLVGTGYPLYSALNLLIRGLWILPLFLVSSYTDSQISFQLVLDAWLLFEGISVAYMAIILYRLNFVPKCWVPTDFGWIKRGWRVGAKYTFLGLLLTLSITIQRIILGETHAKENVGIFQFYFAMTVFLPNLIEAAFFSMFLPEMIKKAASREGNLLVAPKLGIPLILIAIVILSFILINQVISQILSVLGKQELLIHKNLLWLFSIYSIFYFMSRFFHYQLYAASRDKYLIFANLSVFFTATLTCVYFIPSLGIIGAAYSLVLTGVVMLIVHIIPFFLLSTIRRC